MTLDLRSVKVATGEDADGLLVFDDGTLVAILVMLSAQHEEDAGHWYLEAGFGRLAVALNPVFDDLDAAKAWIADHLIE